MMNALTQDQKKFILESAILAPSADNQHRIRFEWKDGVLNVRHVLAPPHYAEDYKRILSLLSLGALSENLTLAAGRFGINAKPELARDSNDPGLAVRVRWSTCEISSDSLWSAIPNRHTNRRLIFHGPKLSAEEKASLNQVAANLPDCQFTWLDDKPLKGQALRLMRRAEGERFRNRLLHQELFSAIRFDVDWHTSCDEGLPPGALEIEPPLRKAFSLLRHWSVMRLVNLIGGHSVLGWRAADLPCRLSPHLGVIAVNRTDDQSIFAAGRAFQRIWLAITQLGFALQPMPAAALYALEEARLGGTSASFQPNLRDGWQTILPGRHPLMLFRVGRAIPAAVMSSRKPLEHYLDIDTLVNTQS